MADEIRRTSQISVRKAGFVSQYSLASTQTQTGTGGDAPGTVSIGTSEEDISFGDIVPGLVVIENNDPTNYVTYGPKSGGSMVPMGKVLPLDYQEIYLAGSVTLRMAANTAAVECRIRGYDA